MAKIKAKKYHIIEVKKNKSLADMKLKMDLSLLPDKLFLKNTEHDRIFILVEKDTLCYGGHVCINILNEEKQILKNNEPIKIAEYTFVNIYSDVPDTVFEQIIFMTETFVKLTTPIIWQRIGKKDVPVAAQKAAKHMLFSEREDCWEKCSMMGTAPLMPIPM